MMKKSILVALVGGLLVLGGILWATNAKQSGHLANLAGGDTKLFAMDNKPAKSESYTKSGINQSVMNNCGWTNMKFAEFLGKQYGIAPINGSVDEQYQALANALSQKGVNYFSNTKPNDQLTCCGAADALYAVVGATGGAGTCDLKINELIQKGFIKLPASGGDPCSVLCNVTDAFGGVEKFSPASLGLPSRNPHERQPEIW
jgi:hypothetical protein